MSNKHDYRLDFYSEFANAIFLVVGLIASLITICTAIMVRLREWSTTKLTNIMAGMTIIMLFVVMILLVMVLKIQQDISSIEPPGQVLVPTQNTRATIPTFTPTCTPTNTPQPSATPTSTLTPTPTHTPTPTLLVHKLRGRS